MAANPPAQSAWRQRAGIPTHNFKPVLAAAPSLHIPTTANKGKETMHKVGAWLDKHDALKAGFAALIAYEKHMAEHAKKGSHGRHRTIRHAAATSRLLLRALKMMEKTGPLKGFSFRKLAEMEPQAARLALAELAFLVFMVVQRGESAFGKEAKGTDDGGGT